nr:hypothetical protein [Tanacetum cinerariifolium]
MHFLENRIVHTSDPIVCDFHHMVEMCSCYVDRMVAMGMLFDRIAMMSIGYNFGKRCHIVGLGCRMMSNVNAARLELKLFRDAAAAAAYMK